MKKQRIVLLITAACLPIALLVWLGVRLAREERSMVEHQVRVLLSDQLRESDQSIGKFLETMQRDLTRLTDSLTVDPSEMRRLVRTEPRVSQVFAIDREGHLLHPSLATTTSASERDFVSRAKPFLLDRDLVRASNQKDDTLQGGPDAADNDQFPKEVTRDQSAPMGAATSGWYVWYWGRGLNLIFWRHLDNGEVIGIELNRARWISELIAHLPKSPVQTDVEADWQIRLIDSSNNSVYQWGGYDPPEQAAAFAEIPLSGPLSPWRLRYFVANERFNALAGRSIYFNSFAGIALASIGLVGIVIYLHREASRELREATTRVNFVNQVSHELKTPLTNIRMYAELLQNDLDDMPADESRLARQRLAVVVSESNRLSRLIGNVLTFSSQQRQILTPQLRPGSLDDLTRSVIRQFEPALAGKGIEVGFEGHVRRPVEFDSDFVEQILVNLLSNVERYAAEGGWLRVTTGQNADQCTIRVADRGPGVPPAERERVFQPFYRADDGLESGAGTGLGLAISRNLARLHGGDVTVVDSACGATFEIQLRAPSLTTEDAAVVQQAKMTGQK